MADLGVQTWEFWMLWSLFLVKLWTSHFQKRVQKISVFLRFVWYVPGFNFSGAPGNNCFWYSHYQLFSTYFVKLVLHGVHLSRGFWLGLSAFRQHIKLRVSAWGSLSFWALEKPDWEPAISSCATIRFSIMCKYYL